MAGFNPMKLLQLKSAWESFTARHPKFASFLQVIAKGGFPEGTIIDITITTPDGKNLSSNMRVSSEDIALVQSLKDSFT